MSAPPDQDTDPQSARDTPAPDATFEAATGSGPMPDGLPPLRDVIRSLGIDPKKSLGQNFILDLNLTRRIARAAGPLSGVSVVEIGPGPGGLTRALMLEGAARVIAIERDDRCLPALADLARHYQGRIEVHAADALQIDWPALLARAGPGEYRIVANLPYGIATRLLIGWLETQPWPPWYTRMTLMFQKEVAERIVAPPSTKAYGRLAVISQWLCEPRIVMTLGREAFSPPPKVASAVVDFAPRQRPEPGCDVRVLGRVTAAAFGQRRKMLRSSLKSLTPDTERLLEAAGIPGNHRAEQITVADFARLTATYQQLGTTPD